MSYEFVDIEITSFCNAKCPFCNRTNLVFQPKHLEIEVIMKLPFERIRTALLLGNKGDAIFYPDLFNLIKWIRTYHKTWIQIHTNASAHNELWWIELSRLLKGQGVVVYALDGLKDTHNIHRIGTDFDKIVKNITAFNDVGGKSICQFLKFKHNEHQVETVRELVKFMGSEKLWVRKSRGFNKTLKRPDGAKTRHEINNQKNTEIKCAHLDKPSFVLTVDGEIRPCCFMADDDYNKDFGIHLKQNIRNCQHLLNYMRDKTIIDLHHHTFYEIMNSKYYMGIKKNYKHLYRCNQKCKATFEDIVDEEVI